MTAKTKKPRKLSQQQQIIILFLSDTKSCNWPNEMRIATKLIEEYGFDWLISLKGRTKVISLTWFLGDNGKNFLNDIRKYQSLSFEKEEIVLEDNPVAPPTEVVLKPTSFKQFLNIFNNK
jgi:hypothetical protein